MEERVDAMKELGLTLLVIILGAIVMIGAIARGISKNLGIVGKTVVWILAIAAMLIAIGFVLGGAVGALFV